MYLNKDNKLCLGPLKEGALTLWLQYRRLQEKQIRLHTTRIEYNKNINNCSKKEVSRWSSLVVELTFVEIGLDNKDKVKEEIEEYSVVSVMGITKARATCVKKLDIKEK